MLAKGPPSAATKKEKSEEKITRGIQDLSMKDTKPMLKRAGRKTKKYDFKNF